MSIPPSDDLVSPFVDQYESFDFGSNESSRPVSVMPTPNLNVNFNKTTFAPPPSRSSTTKNPKNLNIPTSPFISDEDPLPPSSAFSTGGVQSPLSPSYSDFGKDHLDRNETVMKRNRWGTQRNLQGKPTAPTRSKTLRWGKRTPSSHLKNEQKDAHADEESDEESDPSNKKNELRTVYFNVPLPAEKKDEDGEPLVQYPRNKVRTTKYTPLSFVPKNITNQFKNVANVYFLTLLILGAFDIFGVPSPGLASVPLCVIVFITAVKDAIEDSRRTQLDNELNNTPTAILEGLHNDNVSGDNISLWRRFKKANSRAILVISRYFESHATKEGRKKAKANANNKVKERKSLETIRSDDNDDFVNGNPFAGRPSQDGGRLKFKSNYWKNVRVGDIVRIANNDEIPADVLILSTSDTDGACYVETKNLDGETNLKVRQSLKCFSNVHRSNQLKDVEFWVESEGPHANLYSYQGNLVYENGAKNEAVTINNMLLRGCTLRNTKWCIGIVIFTGDDTKIMLNAGVTPTKRSRMTRELNTSVIMNFALLFIICFVSGIVNGFWYSDSPNSRDYYEFGTIAGTPAKNGIVGFFVAVILYQSLVPISLYISIEIIKTAQAFFIYSDVGMYYQRLDYPCTPKSWNISDDLGQIEYIFSDKTGTLTQNVMEFKKCTVNGISYGRAYTEALAGLRKRQGIDVEEEARVERAAIQEDRVKMLANLNSISANEQLFDEDLTFVSKEFVEDLKGNKKEYQKSCNEHFMLALALCHSVLIEPSKKEPGKMLLKAQSPDEAALVGTARDMGFGFEERTKKGVIVNVQGVSKEFQILTTLEFNSTRKRMSAIVKIPAANPNEPAKALLICKGADSIIYSRLKKDSDEKLLEITAKHLEEYAVEGLRTLCIAQRELTWEEYLEWNTKHEEAASAIVKREEKMEAVADEIERELVLLGGTAIEDRLQDGVPDSIAILGQAGIKLWVLTGDKVETAINIGFSCNLLGNDMDLLIIKNKLEDGDTEKFPTLKGLNKDPKRIVDGLISSYLATNFNSVGSYEELEQAKSNHEPPSPKYGLIIDGDALKLALNGGDTQRKFLLLCKQCKAVLCCRVSPAQKAAVVKMVKETLDVMTLAIGDGSNDVAMIQAADVGVGIAGEEGRQAVMSSDYAIGQFRFLTRLVLVHGRWSYKRLSEMIPSFFYKNVIFTMALFWYGIYNNFDGSYLFEFTYLMFYNLAFTSLPVIFMGILDQDVSDVVSLLIPQLYRTGILRSEWTMKKFWFYMCDGIYQSTVSFFFPYLLFRIGFSNQEGLPIDHRYLIGTTVATIAILSCNFYILFHQYRWDWFSGLFIALSILIVFGWTGIWSSPLYAAEYYKAAVQLYGSGSFWACVAIGVICCLLPRFMYDFYGKLFNPSDVDIIRECVRRGDFAHYPITYDPTDPNRPKISRYSRNMYDVEEQSSLGDSNGSSGDATAVSDKIGKTEETTFKKPAKRASFFQRGANRNNKKVISSYHDNGSIIDTYNQYAQSSASLQTEEIPMEDFNKRLSINVARNTRGRASLDLPELTTAKSLISQSSKH